MTAVDTFVLVLVGCTALLLLTLVAHETPSLFQRGLFLPAYLLVVLMVVYLLTISI